MTVQTVDGTVRYSWMEDSRSTVQTVQTYSKAWSDGTADGELV